MEFALTGDHLEVARLAEQIFAESCQPHQVAAIERSGGFDAGLWKTLADADLLGIALPEEVGGSGLGVLGLVALLEQAGRRTAPVPLWSVLATAAMPIAQFGTDAHRATWLEPLLSGSTLVTGSFETAADGSAVLTGAPGPRGWTVSGTVDLVVGGAASAAFVLPFTDGGTVRVAVIESDRAGLTVTPEAVTDWESAASLHLSGVQVDEADLLVGDGAQISAWTTTRARIALSALATGLCAEAVAITAAYTSERLQFDRPLSTNQAVTQRAADAHLDTERIRLTTYKAAWHADAGEEAEAAPAAVVAKWWASTGGFRVVSATQHLHGGISADTDYPIHRYYLWGRQIFFTLGTAGSLETELGAVLDHLTPIGAAS